MLTVDDIRLSIEKLTTSGLAVTNQGEDLAGKHATADGRIETAHAGWQGQSASAMATRWATWQESTNTLLTRLSDHAQGLHNGAQGFSEFEAAREREMRELSARGDAAAERAAKRL